MLISSTIFNQLPRPWQEGMVQAGGVLGVYTPDNQFFYLTIYNKTITHTTHNEAKRLMNPEFWDIE